jgi:hypothetical protein
MDSLEYRPDGGASRSDTIFGGDRMARKGKSPSSGEHPKVPSNARIKRGSDGSTGVARGTGSSGRRPSRFRKR